MKKYVAGLLTLLLSTIVFAKHEDRPDLRPVKIPAVLPDSMAANPSSRLSRLNALMKVFNERFDKKGVYIDNDDLSEKYAKAQEQFVQKMRMENAVQTVLVVGNDIRNILVDGRDHFLRESVLIDENGDFLGIISEKITYKDDFSRSLPRVFPYYSLVNGQVMIAARDKVALRGKMSYENPSLINFDLEVSTNILEEIIMTEKIQLEKKSDGRWTAMDPQNNREVKKLLLRIKIISLNPIKPNGGIEKVEFDSRTNLDEMPNLFDSQPRKSSK